MSWGKLASFSHVLCDDNDKELDIFTFPLRISHSESDVETLMVDYGFYLYGLLVTVWVLTTLCGLTGQVSIWVKVSLASAESHLGLRFVVMCD